jgi:hypothetical protein
MIQKYNPYKAIRLQMVLGEISTLETRARLGALVALADTVIEFEVMENQVVEAGKPAGWRERLPSSLRGTP